MLKTRLTTRNKGATVESPNKPTEGSGPRATLYPFLSVEYSGSCVEQLDKATLADPESCPNIGDHLRRPCHSSASSSGVSVRSPNRTARALKSRAKKRRLESHAEARLTMGEGPVAPRLKPGAKGSRQQAG